MLNSNRILQLLIVLFINILVLSNVWTSLADAEMSMVIREIDNDPSCQIPENFQPWELLFSNGVLTCNTDGSVTVNVSAISYDPDDDCAVNDRFFWRSSGTWGCGTNSDILHDATTGYIVNEHLNWVNSVGTIHTDNYIEGHTDGANCSAGNYPLGVDANGVVQSCTAVPAGYAPDDDCSTNDRILSRLAGVWGCKDYSNWDTAYGWGDHSVAGYLTSETSHADVLVDGDFGSAGLMKTDGAGAYSVITDSSANWDTAYTHSINNTQAHSDYLLNNASDTTSGVLTATGFISNSNTGFDASPGSDVDLHLITVNVTGTPKFWWDESEDSFTTTKPFAASDSVSYRTEMPSFGGIRGFRYHSASAGAINWLSHRGRGTQSSPEVVQNGDILGRFFFRGYSANAGDFAEAGWFGLEVDGTPDSGADTTDMPGRFVFATAPEGTASGVERMRITSAGRGGFGTATPLGLWHIDQSSTTAAIPVLYLDQADISEEFIHLKTSADQDMTLIKLSVTGTPKFWWDESEDSFATTKGLNVVGSLDATTVTGANVTSGNDPGHTHSASAGADTTAIHDNVAAEISVITEKASPATGDWLIIEDAADSNNKKRVNWSSLPGVGSGEANTMSSQGTGTSIYYQKSGVDLQLNAIKSENNRLSVALDGATHDIELTVNEANIDHDALTNFLASEHVDWAGAGAGTIHTDNYIEGGAGTDTTAIHDNVASEISAITEKVTPVDADMIIIEDSADSNNKKMVQVGNLPGGADRIWMHVNNSDATLTTSQYLTSYPNIPNADRGVGAVRAGSITGLAVNTYVTTCNATCTLRWHIYKNGVSVWYLDIDVTSGDNGTYQKVAGTQATGIDTFVVGDIVAVYYESIGSSSSLNKANATFELTLD